MAICQCFGVHYCIILRYMYKQMLNQPIFHLKRILRLQGANEYQQELFVVDQLGKLP